MSFVRKQLLDKYNPSFINICCIQMKNVYTVTIKFHIASFTCELLTCFDHFCPRYELHRTLALLSVSCSNANLHIDLKNCDKLSEKLFCIWKHHKAILMDLGALLTVPIIRSVMFAQCNGLKYIIAPYLFQLCCSVPHITKTAWITAVLSTLKEEMDGFIWAGKNSHFNRGITRH